MVHTLRNTLKLFQTIGVTHYTSELQNRYSQKSYLSTRQIRRDVLSKTDIVSMIYQMFKCRLSQITDTFNGQTEYYAKTYTIHVSLNLRCITIHVTS